MKKWLICWWLHNKYRCYPDVGGKGTKGKWHCSKCTSCHHRCSQCGSLTQILHFFPEVLPLLNEDESVPSFCSGFCGAKFVIEKRSEKALMTCTIPKFLT